MDNTSLAYLHRLPCLLHFEQLNELPGNPKFRSLSRIVLPKMALGDVSRLKRLIASTGPVYSSRAHWRRLVFFGRRTETGGNMVLVSRTEANNKDVLVITREG